MRLISSLFVALFLIAGFALPASAAKCKNVKIKVTNNTGKEIKVTNAKYWDTEKEKWRNENFSNWKIANTDTESKTKHLEYVKNQQVKIYVYYKENTGGSRWTSKKKSSTVNIGKCTGGQTASFSVR